MRRRHSGRRGPVPSVVAGVLRDASADLAAAGDEEAIMATLTRAVGGLLPPDAPYRVGLAVGPAGDAGRDAGPAEPARSLVAVTASPSGDQAPVGALMTDSATAARPHVYPAMQVLSVLAGLGMQRIRLDAEVSRTRADSQTSALVEQTRDVILIVDDDDRIRYASPSARSVFGTSALRGVALPDMVDAAERRLAAYLLRQARSGGGSEGAALAARADWTIHSEEGTTALVEVSCRDLRSEASVRGVVVTLRDVTAQRRLEHELTARVFRDVLTGLPNRVSFVDRVGQALAGGGGSTSVAFVNIDDFRLVNERLGHAAGDRVLASVGQRLMDVVGSRGVVARLGADEFAVLAPGVTSGDGMDALAGQIIQALGRPVAADGESTACSASVGVATASGAVGPQELMRHADVALHAAKSTGAGQWRRYEPSMGDSMLYAQEMRTALREAVRDGSLFLEYQPIVVLGTGRTVGLEALVRWQHPTRGRLLPSEFIDLAEESGLVVPMGTWVLGAALKGAARWRRSVPNNPVSVSVNVSAQQFRSPGFVDTVRGLLAEHHVPASGLIVEITESVLLRDDDEVWEQLRRMRRWGVRIAIDDFGTGYSALGYLRQVPLDMVKLDRVFVATLASSSRQRELVGGIVAITRALNLDVVAEGIETEQQRGIAGTIGCTYGQGYFFARPMPESDVTSWLANETG
jgi:diguanylate cyclase (GGDEF)-like protein/PAS domain S-box-containing protein